MYTLRYEYESAYKSLEMLHKFIKFGIDSSERKVINNPPTTANIKEVFIVNLRFSESFDPKYFAINIPCDTCNECGYCDEIGENCPECGCDDISRLRRVTGYLTGDYKTAFNKGKQQEVEQRYKHSKELEGWERDE